MLSNSANEINRRKLLINAEVTAITTLIELIGGVTFVIHLYLKKGTSSSTFLHAVVVKCVVMPYAFLMNTSHNKNRIVEKGWKNVLINIVNHPVFASFAKDAKEPTASNIKEKTHTPNEPDELQISRKKVIFEISSSENEVESIAIQKSLEDLPCSSKEDWMNNSLDETNDEFPILDIKKLGKQKYIEFMSYKLARKLEKSLEDEKLYIEAFKNLLEFTENCKQDKLLSEIELETSSEIAYTCNKEFSKRKSKKKCNKHPSEVRLSSFYEDNNSNDMNLESGSILDSKNTKIKEYESRLTKRKEIVVELLQSCKEYEKFNRILDQIIDIEESFASKQTDS